MSTEVVERLRATLDEAERVALDAAMTMIGGSWEVSRHPRRLPMVVDRGHQVAADLADETATHIASWDPNTVLRLVARDRALLMEYEALKSLIEEENGERGDGMVSLLAHAGDTRDGWLRAGRLLALQHGVERAAEFWLRPEVTDADH